MKPQDIVFFAVLIVLLVIPKLRKPNIFVVLGLACLVVAMPLFAFWIFFTAQHLVWYSLGFFLIAIILFIINELTSLKR